jgi:hypothetical protein
VESGVKHHNANPHNPDYYNLTWTKGDNISCKRHFIFFKYGIQPKTDDRILITDTTKIHPIPTAGLTKPGKVWWALLPKISGWKEKVSGY